VHISSHDDGGLIANSHLRRWRDLAVEVSRVVDVNRTVEDSWRQLSRSRRRCRCELAMRLTTNEPSFAPMKLVSDSGTMQNLGIAFVVFFWGLMEVTGLRKVQHPSEDWFLLKVPYLRKLDVIFLSCMHHLVPICMQPNYIDCLPLTWAGWLNGDSGCIQQQLAWDGPQTFQSINQNTFRLTQPSTLCGMATKWVPGFGQSFNSIKRLSKRRQCGCLFRWTSGQVDTLQVQSLQKRYGSEEIY